MTRFNQSHSPTARFRIKSGATGGWNLMLEPIAYDFDFAEGDEALIEYVIPEKGIVTKDGVLEISTYPNGNAVLYLPRFDDFRVTNQAGKVVVEVGTL